EHVVSFPRCAERHSAKAQKGDPKSHRAPKLAVRWRSISSPGGASLPCAILEGGVSLLSPGAKATTLRCAALPPALQCSPSQFDRARACGSSKCLLAKSPAPSRSSPRVDRWYGR